MCYNKRDIKKKEKIMKNDIKDLQFIWAGEREVCNRNVRFCFDGEITRGKLILCAADYYQVFVNGAFCGYGPNRAPEGYARLREIALTDVKNIEIKVSAYNVSNYSCDRQLPFFAARIIGENGAVSAESLDFKAFLQSEREENVPRYSFQRGFVEVYDYRNCEQKPLECYTVKAPQILDCPEDVSKYEALDFRFVNEGVFDGFRDIVCPWWKDMPEYIPAKDAFDVAEEVGKKAVGSFYSYDYVLPYVVQGFFSIDVKAEEETKIYLVFDEYVPDGKWAFRRIGCNNCVCYTLPKGTYRLMTFEPYVLMHLKVLVKGKANVKPKMILLQNDTESAVKLSGNEELVCLFEAAERSFRSNSTDIFMDCGRERAGWLLDSRFAAIAEEMFTGKNSIERAFLENIALANVPEIPEKMIPMCFPSQHENMHNYIPNYAMWYVIQIGEYYKRTGDRTLVEEAKEKAYALYEYFQAFKNEYGLLENLTGWIFIEWSVANDPEYVRGVNYPSNLVYAEMLKTMSELYGDTRFSKEGEQILSYIEKNAYTGEFFVDNATRDENGVLQRRDDHISETCQYYALREGLNPDPSFSERVKTELGPFRKEGMHENVGRSNILPGHCLRFCWLSEIGEHDLLVKELVKCMKHMYDTTGTLWEKDAPTNSLSHGFTSIAAVLLVGALTGYKGLSGGIPVFGEGAKEKYGVEVTFCYKQFKKKVSV